MTDWRSRWACSHVERQIYDVRHSVGWAFHDPDGAVVWQVFRSDGGPFPVFSARRGEGDLPEPAELFAMTHEAVEHLFTAASLPDPIGWFARTMSRGLMFAALDVVSWEGDEWALDQRRASPAEIAHGMPEEIATEWAEPDALRIPFNRVVVRGSTFALQVGWYQDNNGFALNFDLCTGDPLSEAEGILRTRRDLPFLRGPVESVEITYDNHLGWNEGRGFLSEVLLHTASDSLLLMAAEIYEPGDWRIYDEMVVVVPSLDVADSLDWTGTPRPSWRSTERP